MVAHGPLPATQRVYEGKGDLPAEVQQAFLYGSSKTAFPGFIPHMEKYGMSKAAAHRKPV